MFASLRTPLLAVGAALTLSACTYGTGLSLGVGSGYGYGGGYYDVYNDPYFSGRYGYTPNYGWYNNYFYPGNGYYVYDRRGGRYTYNDDQRRFWDRNRGYIRSRQDLRDYERYDRRTPQGQAFQRERLRDREALGRGEVTQEQFRANRRDDRQTYREGLRRDLRNGNSLRGGDGVGLEGGAARARHDEIRNDVMRQRAERRARRGN